MSSLEWTRAGLSIALLILSLGLHEAAHAWTALRCGDPTGRDLGRISLNPLVHVDPFMTVILPLILFLTNMPIFGGAKPVPVNFHNLRHPHRDMALVALAGPLTNFLLAVGFLFLFRLLVFELHVWDSEMIGAQVLITAVQFNLLLAVFNLIPIPPLDGSRVMTWLLPTALRDGYRRLEGVGLLLVVLLIFYVPGFRPLLNQTLGTLLVAMDSFFRFLGL